MTVTEFRLKTLVERDFLVRDLFLFVLSLWQEMGSNTRIMTTATFPESSLCTRRWAKHFHGFLTLPHEELEILTAPLYRWEREASGGEIS